VHWINKENKDRLKELNSNTDITVLEELTESNNDDSNDITALEELTKSTNDDSNDIPLHSTQSEEPRET
jgi:(p)ppGpp synthase/HD superfamily hydrolase